MYLCVCVCVLVYFLCLYHSNCLFLKLSLAQHEFSSFSTIYTGVPWLIATLFSHFCVQLSLFLNRFPLHSIFFSGCCCCCCLFSVALDFNVSIKSDASATLSSSSSSSVDCCCNNKSIHANFRVCMCATRLIFPSFL